MNKNIFTDLIQRWDGLVLPGGCQHCAAEQELHAHHHGHNIHAIVVSHDADCPVMNN